jgi:hypothetical protein
VTPHRLGCFTSGAAGDEAVENLMVLAVEKLHFSRLEQIKTPEEMKFVSEDDLRLPERF